MSEGSDRRARKKAATRQLVLETAQRLFDQRGFEAVTISDIAATADVAVQTVFNHFATKEDLFFAGRTPWVEAPAEAVRGRRPDESPVAALREALLRVLGEHVAALADTPQRRMVTTMAASPALESHERELNDQARARLEDALLEAWSDGGAPSRENVHLTAALVASTWMATVRTIASEARRPLPEPEDAVDRARQAVSLAGRVFDSLALALDSGASLQR
ncbi:TetR/AcrR family transcriptional regulator [Trujillonella endophytica]|uniref:Transcriptional regulator, TetR family n=1 Tax=Trujillonella endophytica TaxID=673521 RepID=A0A1H8W4D6_9ACTN|nr:TetR/AcrR family transcriptional regulator [Trujillella endophytica]SEP22501.1 transcriptional regulator, TetR family [Trujillella endophytica]